MVEPCRSYVNNPIWTTVCPHCKTLFSSEEMNYDMTEICPACEANLAGETGLGAYGGPDSPEWEAEFETEQDVKDRVARMQDEGPIEIVIVEK